MTDYIPIYTTQNPVLGAGTAPVRGRGFVFVDNFSREAITPTGWPTIYTNAENGAGGTSAIDAAINRVVLTTDINAGDDQDMRTSGLRIDRNYTSLITGMTMPQMQTSTVQIDLPFSVDSAADGEAFIGIGAGAQLSALPTTTRHLGVYWDISAGVNYMLSSANGAAQSTTDTTVAVDTAVHILRITWTAEQAATLQLYTAAGATEGTGKTVAAFNTTVGQAHEIHWFVQAEAGGARALTLYPYRVAWS